MGRIILVSAPWPMFSRPSIQLGALKAYVGRQFPDIEVATHHLYLTLAASLGYPVYSAISRKSWLAETVYAALLYPERFSVIEKLFRKESRGISELHVVDFRALTEKVRAVTETFVAGEPWHTAGLAGFSVCLCQLTATLYLIRQIRQTASNLTTVIGGSIVAGRTGRDLLRVFSDIDFAVNGEGELPLTRLIEHLAKDPDPTRVPFIPGVVPRKSPGPDRQDAIVQVPRLDDLPLPDFTDYFDMLRILGGEKSFFPTIPMELSRGCRWQKVQDRKDKGACAFCNLNLQWEGYRTKTPGRAAAEIDAMTSRYRTLSVAFVDNLLPVKDSETIFRRFGNLKKDFRLFGETRAVTPRRVLEVMQAAGLCEIQIGIEALSTRLLKKLNKGTTAIQNMEIMKNCEELGIANPSNLIVQFPGSDRQDVTETLRGLSFVGPFHPLTAIPFWMGLGSPVWRNPGKFGIDAVFNHPNYARIFPRAVFKAVRFMIGAYRGDLVHQRKLWRPVRIAVAAWEKTYAALHTGPFSGPILSYRDGRDFMIIRQKRQGAEPMTHRLTGISREIYLYSRQARSMERIVGRWAHVGEERILPFLKMMVEKKLMFAENNRYLSLAVKVRK